MFTWTQVATSLWCLCNRITFLSGLINRKSVLSTCKTMVRLWSSISTGISLDCFMVSCVSLFSEHRLDIDPFFSESLLSKPISGCICTSFSQIATPLRTFLSMSGDFTPKFVNTDWERCKCDKGLDSLLLLVSLATESYLGNIQKVQKINCKFRYCL